MATRFGDTVPEFGLAVESSGYVQDFSERSLFDEATVEDNDGGVVAVSLYNQRTEGSITVVKKTGGVLPTVGTAVLLSNLVSVAKVVLTEVERKPEQKGFAKYSYTFKAWAGVSLA